MISPGEDHAARLLYREQMDAASPQLAAARFGLPVPAADDPHPWDTLFRALAQRYGMSRPPFPPGQEPGASGGGR